MRIYATSEDLSEWTSSAAPSNAVQLLRSASALIESSTKLARYRTTPAGLPVDEPIATAFTQAVCAQAAFWATHKVDPSLGTAGIATAVASKSLGGASVSYLVDSKTASAKAQELLSLCPDAYFVLEQAGLLHGFVRRS